MADWNGIGTEWVNEWVLWTTGREIGDRSWGTSELVQLTLEESLEGVGLLVSDPSLVVLVEVAPGGVEVSIKISWNLVWLELVGSLQDGTGSELSIILHEELLASLVTRWGESLSGVSGENVVHDLILIGTVVARDVHFLPSSGIHVSTLGLRIITELNSCGSTKKGGDSKCEFHSYQ
jgi:hypothetical protein